MPFQAIRRKAMKERRLLDIFDAFAKVVHRVKSERKTHQVIPKIVGKNSCT